MPISGWVDRTRVFTLSLGHTAVDLCQGVVPAVLPFLRESMALSYAASGSLVLAASVSSSVVQPVFGHWADRFNLAWLTWSSVLVAGVLLGLGLQSGSYWAIFASVFVSGVAIAAFHPEAARQVNLAAGAQRATGMSVFVVGGVLGFALAPLLTAGAWHIAGVRGMLVLVPLAIVATLLVAWGQRSARLRPEAKRDPGARRDASRRDRWGAFAGLASAILLRSIVFYGLNTFGALYFIDRWHIDETLGTLMLTLFLGAGIPGLLLGGWLADRLGRLRVVRVSLTLTLLSLLAFASAGSPLVAGVLFALTGFCLLSSGSTLVVIGQEYLPNHLGTASGVTLGLAVSVGGIVAPVLGRLGDGVGLQAVLYVLAGVVAGVLTITLLLPGPARGAPNAREGESPDAS